MKPTAIVLLVSGVLFLIGGTWASFTLPVRFDASTSSDAIATMTMETRSNLWGNTLHISMHWLYRTPKNRGELTGLLLDEAIISSYVWNGEMHGQRVLRERSGTQWSESVKWYLNGVPVTREEWERR